jgi:hypothetical protein
VEKNLRQKAWSAMSLKEIYRSGSLSVYWFTFSQRIASEGSFFSYVAGIYLLSVLLVTIAGTLLAILSNSDWAALIGECGIEIRNYRTTLPMKKGLSSSAAVCVLVVQAFSDFFQLNLPLPQVMELAYLGEMKTPSRLSHHSSSPLSSHHALVDVVAWTSVSPWVGTASVSWSSMALTALFIASPLLSQYILLLQISRRVKTLW